MLAFLGDRAGDRKLRLFAVACSRRVWHLLDDLGRAAVDAAEGFADGVLGPEALRAARSACKYAGGRAAWYAAASSPAVAARNAAHSALSGVAPASSLHAPPDAAAGSRLAAERGAQAALLRCIFGDPFRPVTRDPVWRTTQLLAIAERIYCERLFGDLPVLADALEEAGCTDAELLGHCRDGGEHARGCWAVDLVLGRS
jgi:hypothetical protein